MGCNCKRDKLLDELTGCLDKVQSITKKAKSEGNEDVLKEAGPHMDRAEEISKELKCLGHQH